MYFLVLGNIKTFLVWACSVILFCSEGSVCSDKMLAADGARIDVNGWEDRAM